MNKQIKLYQLEVVTLEGSTYKMNMWGTSIKDVLNKFSYQNIDDNVKSIMEV